MRHMTQRRLLEIKAGVFLLSGAGLPARGGSYHADTTCFSTEQLLKKSLCPVGDSSGQEYVLYYISQLHIVFISARWIYDLTGEFCRFLRPFSAGRNFRSNIDTGGNATGPGTSLSRRLEVRK